MIVSSNVVCGVLDEQGSQVVIQVTGIAVLTDGVHREVARHDQIVSRRRRHLLLDPRPLLGGLANRSERELGIVFRVALLSHSISRQIHRIDEDYIQSCSIGLVSKRLRVVDRRKVPAVRVLGVLQLCGDVAIVIVLLTQNMSSVTTTAVMQILITYISTQ